MSCALSLCDFPAVEVRCDAPGCSPPVDRCARHRVQRGCDACGKMLCDDHALRCKRCEIGEPYGSWAGDPRALLVGEACADCLGKKTEHASCAECDEIYCESHFDLTVSCDVCSRIWCQWSCEPGWDDCRECGVTCCRSCLDECDEEEEPTCLDCRSEIESSLKRRRSEGMATKK